MKTAKNLNRFNTLVNCIQCYQKLTPKNNLSQLLVDSKIRITCKLKLQFSYIKRTNLFSTNISFDFTYTTKSRFVPPELQSNDKVLSTHRKKHN